MREIDWSKAPKGYPLWIEELGKKVLGDDWHREEEDRYVDARGQSWTKDEEDVHFKVHRNPDIAMSDASAQAGEGLPPVGSVQHVEPDYRRVTVLAHGISSGEQVAICQDGNRILLALPKSFRTPEQIAAEERENTVNDMCHIVQKGHEFEVNRSDMYALYDAGYRWIAPEDK